MKQKYFQFYQINNSTQCVRRTWKVKFGDVWFIFVKNVLTALPQETKLLHESAIY